MYHISFFLIFRHSFKMVRNYKHIERSFKNYITSWRQSFFIVKMMWCHFSSAHFFFFFFFLTWKLQLRQSWSSSDATKKLTNNARVQYMRSFSRKRRMRFQNTHDSTGNLPDWIVASRLFIQMKTMYRSSHVNINYLNLGIDFCLFHSECKIYPRYSRQSIELWSPFIYPCQWCNWCIVIMPLLLQHLASGIMHFRHL